MIASIYNKFLSCRQIETDTRKINGPCIFFALKGPSFNGNHYAKQAIQKGATYCIVDEEAYVEDSRYILVPDVLDALQSLAIYHRKKLQCDVFAITGSNGKTTTKELISVVLAEKFKVQATAGNFNNHIGVPLTLLSLKEETEIAIIEMGANHIGEIAELCQIARPNLGLITNIGRAHLEGFGGIQGVIQAKGELYHWLAKNNGTAFINLNEGQLSEMANILSDQITYGNANAMLGENFRLLTADPYVQVIGKIDSNEIKISTKLPGAYNFQNILSAIAVGIHFNISPKRIKNALETYIPSNNRSQLVHKNSNKILLDAYNANPTSMKEAIVNFAKIDHAKKILVLGDMKELGTYTDKSHQSIVELINSFSWEEVYLVGEAFLRTNHAGMLAYQDISSLKASFSFEQHNNTYFLLKGSRSMKLEQLLN